MKNLYLILTFLISSSIFGQIEQDINKNTGTQSNPITEIDSIRFNGSMTEMEIVLDNGNVESHNISDIDNVTFSGQLVGEIDGLDCSSATINGTLVEGVAASGIDAEIDYTGGNGGPHNGQTLTSTGVTGLTAELTAGNFASGAGTLTYEITGTPSSDGTASFPIEIGGETCTLEVVVESGSVASLDCAGANITGTLVDGVVASGVNAEIDYTGGNGGPHNGQTITSTGVTGLTATLTAGSFTNGAGTLIYDITDTPSSDGTASFAIEIGDETCILEVNVLEYGVFPPNTVHCGILTEVIDVVNPATGDTWMDRNLGASQVADSSDDQNAYGDLYQWGRGSDGHQCRTSSITSSLSSTDQPGHGDFITTSASPHNWRNPENVNLWQGVNGVNNPCPTGYRLPTEAELNTERLSWSSADTDGAFSSPLKLPVHDNRNNSGGLVNPSPTGQYWSSTIDVTANEISRILYFHNLSIPIGMYSRNRSRGYAVRCIKN